MFYLSLFLGLSVCVTTRIIIQNLELVNHPIARLVIGAQILVCRACTLRAVAPGIENHRRCVSRGLF